MIFKKDSAILGLFLGLCIPVVLFVFQNKVVGFTEPSMQLFALVFNLPLIRYYLINLKYEKTGKGILFATFTYALVWVYINQL